jgi:hypothetical protein
MPALAMTDPMQISQALEATLNPDAGLRKQGPAAFDPCFPAGSGPLRFDAVFAAETFLGAVKTSPQFSVTLLKLLEAKGNSPVVRQSAAIYFKNIVKNHWRQREDEEFVLPDADKELLKPHLVSLMLSVEAKYEKQLSEAISIIADVDFPDRWPSLLPELVSKFGCGDLSIINGVLSTTYSIFKRYNFKFRSDDLFREIKVTVASLRAFVRALRRLPPRPPPPLPPPSLHPRPAPRHVA